MPERKPTLDCFLVAHTARLQEIFGGNAVSDEYGIGRHVANLFVTQTYEGQSDIHSKPTLMLNPRADTCRSDSRPSDYRDTRVFLN